MCETEGLKASSVGLQCVSIGLGRKDVYGCVIHTDEPQNGETFKHLYYGNNYQQSK